MHDFDNPYATPPDFAALAIAVPSFAPFLRRTSQGHPTINFKDEDAVRALTSALLERDFQLRLSLPSDRLCPMVPGRLEYVLWIMKLALSARAGSETDSLVGLDIGTGSSCIYPLLSCRSCRGASFIATDIDEHSLAFARRNIDDNKLTDRIQLLKVDQDASIFSPNIWTQAERVDFSMCNPPFYASEEDIAMSAAAKDADPHAVCTGGALEMITEGGELGFVRRMVQESLSIGERIRWFSSLLGKHTSLCAAVELLKAQKIENYTVAEIGQGQTKRWIVAWSLQGARLSSSSYHPSNNHALAKILPPSNAHTYWPPSTLTRAQTRDCLYSTLAALPHITTNWRDYRCTLKASSNSWSRSARRAAVKAAGGFGMEVDTSATFSEPLLQAELRVEVGGESGGLTKVTAEWTHGLDSRRADWNSLWSFLIRKLADDARSLPAAAAGRGQPASGSVAMEFESA